MEINIGISECDKNVDNYYGRNIGSHTAPAERLLAVSSPFMVLKLLKVFKKLQILVTNMSTIRINSASSLKFSSSPSVPFGNNSSVAFARVSDKS